MKLWIAVAVALSPLVSAAIFPKDSHVKMLDAKGFREAMKKNETSLVAFVAPWCGHCQRMAPEYSKAAVGLHPLIPTYAVDCDADKNKKLCANQDVKGFPTVKLFPRGKSLPPMLYEQERTASGFYHFATRRVPKAFTKLSQVGEIASWVGKHETKHRALLLTKDKKVPLLWQVLANKYSNTALEFGTHRDKKGTSSAAMGLEAGGKTESKVLLYPAGSPTPIRYDGLTKLDSLSKFFDSVLDGTADLEAQLERANKKAEKAEKVEEKVKEESEEKEASEEEKEVAGEGEEKVETTKKAVEKKEGECVESCEAPPPTMGVPDSVPADADDLEKILKDSGFDDGQPEPAPAAEQKERPKDEL